MTENEILGTVAVGIGLASHLVYFHGLWKGNVKPHGFTWLIWSLLMAIGFVAQRVEHAGPGSWVLALTCLADFSIAIVAFRQKEVRITRGDWLALLAALSAIPAWLVTSNPLWAVVIISTIDAISLYPTFRKSWQKPYEEGALSFFIGAFQYLLAILAMDVMNLTTTLYPATILTIDMALVVMLIYRRRCME